MKNYKIIFVVFLLLLFPAYKAQSKTSVYYKLDESIPDDYGYTIATKALKEDYDIVSQELILVSKDMSNSDMNMMVNEIKDIDGINLVLSPSSLSEYGLSEEMLSDDIKSIYQTDKYKMVLVNSTYDIATEELNDQITKVNNIVKKYDENSIVAGEGPLMKDLVEITDQDFKNVNTTSIAVIFVLMLIVLKSISLPVLLVTAIEFAIFINMGVPYFTGTEIPFIASVVIGTIQLGATIDYAILMTTKYLEERQKGTSKEDSIKIALDNSVTSIVVSGLCFFAATIGVGVVSKIDMIGSLCTLISRGAIISMIVVITVVPSLLMIFDKLICKTTLGFNKKEGKMNMKKNVKKMVSWALIAMLMTPALPVSALTKDETVYSKLETNGDTKYTIVTEHLINDKEEDNLIDSTDLKDIINTNGSEKYTIDGDNIVWSSNKKDIYYKGSTEKELPVTLKATYKLDGKELDVKDMLGKKGNVEITLTYKNSDKHVINGSTMYTPFVVTTATTFDSTTTSNLKVTNGKVVSNGKTYAVAAIATPGLYESLNISELKDMNTIKITFDTTDFELSSIYSMVNAKLIDSSDLKVFNELDSLYSKVDTLKSSSAKLVNGSKELTNGVKQIRSAVIASVNELKNNKETIDENTLSAIGSSAKEQAIKKVESNKENIMKQAMQQVVETENQTHTIKTASDASVDGNAELSGALKLAVKEMHPNASEEELAIAIKETIEGAKTKFYNNALELAKQTAAQAAYQTALQTASETASETSTQVATQVAAVVKNTVINKMVTSLNTLVGGLDSLLDGAQTLSNGIEQFDNEGINKIATLVNDKVKPTSNKLQSLTKLANDYNTFTKTSNNVDSNTKFILVIDSQKKVEEKKETKTTKKANETFMDRVKNLFK